MSDKALTVRQSAQLSMQETMILADAFARSGFFQDANDQAKAVVKILAGQELGIPPVAAMTGIYVVQGRVTLSANLLATLVKRHPTYDYKVLKMDAEICSIAFSANGEQSGVSTFSMGDAEQAGVASVKNWRSYPRNMLFARAMSNGVKWFCPDVAAGAPVYTPDELGQDVNEDGSLSLFATSEQIEIIKNRMIALYPDVELTKDAHFNYLLKRNGHPPLGQLSEQQAFDLLETLGEPTQHRPEAEQATDDLFGDFQGQNHNGAPMDDIDHKAELEEAQREAEGFGKDPAELVKHGTEPEETLPDLTAPSEWAKFWKRCVTDLKFQHRNHALNAFKAIFPHYSNTNMPAIGDAWSQMIDHQREAGRLDLIAE